MDLPESLQRLVSAAGPAIEPGISDEVSPVLTDLGSSGKLLPGLLFRKNGFYAFESSLHLLPSGSRKAVDLETWNSPDSWRNSYGAMAAGLLFFAEDLFGGQFCIGDGGVFSFDPETGSSERLAGDLEGWAEAVLEETDLLTARSLAIEWQRRHGPLPFGMRLVPRVPFVLGGEFSVSNLRLADASEAMRFRGDFAVQIADLPDGDRVRLKVVW